MKKYLLNLLLLVAFALPLATQAQVNLTVHEGTSTNRYVPVYGFYCDDFVKCQSVYPAAELVQMTGGQITGLTYYASTVPGSWGSSTFKVYLMEVANATISSYADYTNATVVYSGALNVSSGTMTITFTTPYTYNGGNLLIGIQSLTDGTYSDAYWYGESVSGASVRGYNSSSADASSAEVQNFLPKTTFSYAPGDQSCPMVSNFAYANLTATSVDLSWSAGGSESEWEITINPAVDDGSVFIVSDTTYSFTNLVGNTNYSITCRAICGSDDTSYASSLSFRTPCTSISEFPWNLDFEGETASQALPCWSLDGSTTSSATDNPSYVWGVYANGGNNMMRMYNYLVQSGAAVTTSPIIELPEDGIYELTFNYSNRSSSGNMYVNIISGDSTTLIGTIPSTGNYDYTNPGTFTEFSYPLTDFVGQNIQLQFSNQANYGSGAIFVDDISVHLAPTCIKPGDLHIVSINANSATLAWTERGTASAWNVIYDTMGVEYDMMQVETATDTTIELTNLEPNTQYIVYVQADCGGDTSFNISITFRTACIPIPYEDMPYTEDFESWATGNTAAAPSCVYKGTNYSTTYSYPYVYSTEHHSGNNSMYLYSYTYSSYVYFTMPFMSAAVDSLQVSFWMKKTSDSYASAKVQVGVMTDPNDFNTFTSLAEFSPVYGEGWNLYDVALNHFTGESGYIAFASPVQGSSAYYPYIAIDDITVDYIPTCPRVTNLQAIYASNDSITLSWTPGNTETQWIITYGDVEEYANDTIYTIEGLEPNTLYTFNVRAYCGGDDTAAVTSINARSACGITPVPYNEDFETYPASTYSTSPDGGPACWDVYSTGTTVVPHVIGSGSYLYVHSGTKALSFYGYTNFAAMPLFNQPLNTLSMSFWYKQENSSNGTLTVGYITVDDTNFNTFHAIRSLPGNSGSMREVEFDFSELSDSAYRIAFKWVWTSQYSVCIDDISVWKNSSCPTPTNVRATGVTNNQAEIRWNAEDDYASTTLFFGTSNNFNSVYDSVEVVGNSYQMTNLNGSTTYYVWARGNCSEEPSREVMISFTTQVDCAPIENLTIFGGMHHMMLRWNAPIAGNEPSAYIVAYKTASETTWTTDSTTNPYFYIDNLTMNTSYQVKVTTACDEDYASAVTGSFTTANCGESTVGNGSSSYAYVPSYPYYNYSYTQQIYTADELANAGDTLAGIGFYYNGNGTLGSRNITLYLGNTSKSSFSSSSDYIAPSRFTQVFSGTFNIASGWNMITFDSTFLRNADSNLVVVMNDLSGNYYADASNYTWAGYAASAPRSIYYWWDDDPFSPAAPDMDATNGAVNFVSYAKFVSTVCNDNGCVAPNVAINEVTNNSATITWFPEVDGASYVISYIGEGDSVATVAATGVTANTYTISNLNPGINYAVTVATVCQGDSLKGSHTFTTECDLINVPYTEDFQNREYGYFARNCWTVGTTSTAAISQDTYPYVCSLQGDENNRLLLLYQGGYVIMPAPADPLNTLQIRFTLTQGRVDVPLLFGLLNDPSDPIASMNVLETLVRSDYDSVNSSVIITYPFDQVTDSAKYIVFWSRDGVNYSFLDNIVLEPIPACSAVSDVVVSNVTTNSADLTWTVNGTLSTSFIVEYGPRGFVPGDGTATMMNVSSNNAVLSGLNHSSNYDVYVYAICASTGDTSYNSNVASFTTPCDLVTLPYFEDFEHVLDPGSTAKQLPNCWNYVMTNSSYATTTYLPTAYYSTATNQVSSGLYCLYLYGESVTVLPEMPVSVDSLMISFHKYTSSSDYKLIVGAVDSITPGFEASFVGIDTLNANVSNPTLFLNNYNGIGRYIAFKNVNVDGYGYSYHYIDDILVESIPSCIYPLNFSTTAATSTSADIAWTTSNASDYEYEYGVTGFTRGTGTTGTCTGLSVSISGLTVGTSYDIYVRGICGVGDTSNWSMYTFHTLNADPATVPYACDFSDTTLTNCGFEVVNSSTNNKWYVGAGAGNPANAIYISNDGGVSNNYSNNAVSVSYAYRDLNLAAGEYTYNFDWKANGESSYDYLRAWLAPQSVEFTPDLLPDGSTSPYYFTNVTPAGWLPLDGGQKLNLATSWMTREGTVQVTNPGVYHMVFMWCNDNSSGSQNAAAVDNIEIILNTCPAPANVHASAAGVTSIEVDWTDLAEAAMWQLSYGVGNNPTIIDVAAHPVLLTNLDSLTNYNVRVRAICSATDTGRWSDVVVLGTTICDNASETSTGAQTSTAYYAPVNNYYKYTLSETIIDSAELNGPQTISAVSYYYDYSAASSKSNVDIYLQPTTMSEFGSSSDIVALDSTTAVKVYSGNLNCVSGWNTFVFDTTYEYDGNGNILVIVDDNSNAYSGISYVFGVAACSGSKTIVYYSDSYDPDVTDPSSFSGSKSTYDWRPVMKLISCGAGCPTPVITSTLPTYNSAAITWSSNATDFEVSYKSVSDADYTTPVAVAASNYTLTGLTPATQYTFRVRSVCDSGAVSDWASVNFATDSLPCFVPEDLHQTAINYTSVTLDWTNGGNEQNWVVKVFNSRIGEMLDTVSAHPATITGLAANEQYFATVQAACGSNLDGFSDWSDTISFTTTECVAVSNINCATPTNTSVEVSWTSNGSESAWVVTYGIPGFGQGEEIGRIVATTNPYQLSVAGLEPNTTYEVYVSAQCMEGLTSVPAGPATFTTNDIGISGIEGNANINIYPNPTTGSTTISVNGISGKVNVAIVDMNGREVMSSAMECDGDCEKVMNVEGLAQGAYFVRIYGEEINSIRKLIVR